jgi:hypothetical protein
MERIDPEHQFHFRFHGDCPNRFRALPSDCRTEHRAKSYRMFVMEKIDGDRLRQGGKYVSASKLNLPVNIPHLVGALEVMQKHGLGHFDIHGGNIFVDGRDGLWKLNDFGLTYRNFEFGSRAYTDEQHTKRVCRLLVSIAEDREGRVGALDKHALYLRAILDRSPRTLRELRKAVAVTPLPDVLARLQRAVTARMADEARREAEGIVAQRGRPEGLADERAAATPPMQQRGPPPPARALDATPHRRNRAQIDQRLRRRAIDEAEEQARRDLAELDRRRALAKVITGPRGEAEGGSRKRPSDNPLLGPVGYSEGSDSEDSEGSEGSEGSDSEGSEGSEGSGSDSDGEGESGRSFLGGGAAAAARGVVRDIRRRRD